MGWRPWEVEQCGLAEFMATFEGWCEANGAGGKPEKMTEDEALALRRAAFGE